MVDSRDIPTYRVRGNTRKWTRSGLQYANPATMVVPPSISMGEELNVLTSGSSMLPTKPNPDLFSVRNADVVTNGSGEIGRFNDSLEAAMAPAEKDCLVRRDPVPPPTALVELGLGPASFASGGEELAGFGKGVMVRCNPSPSNPVPSESLPVRTVTGAAPGGLIVGVGVFIDADIAAGAAADADADDVNVSPPPACPFHFAAFASSSASAAAGPAIRPSAPSADVASIALDTDSDCTGGGGACGYHNAPPSATSKSHGSLKDPVYLPPIVAGMLSRGMSFASVSRKLEPTKDIFATVLQGDR